MTFEFPSRGRRTGSRASFDDGEIVQRQLGRPPRGRWTAIDRCVHGYPRTIAVAPLLEDGTPFPTAFWLTCPHLVEAVSALESGGAGAKLAESVAASPALAQEVLAADSAYRLARAAANNGVDPCEGTGIAGQADPLAVKCLHARLAAFLAGVPDPIGGAVAGLVAASGQGLACTDRRCDVPDTVA